MPECSPHKIFFFKRVAKVLLGILFWERDPRVEARGTRLDPSRGRAFRSHTDCVLLITVFEPEAERSGSLARVSSLGLVASRRHDARARYRDRWTVASGWAHGCRVSAVSAQRCPAPPASPRSGLWLRGPAIDIATARRGYVELEIDIRAQAASSCCERRVPLGRCQRFGGTSSGPCHVHTDDDHVEASIGHALCRAGLGAEDGRFLAVGVGAC